MVIYIYIYISVGIVTKERQHPGQQANAEGAFLILPEVASVYQDIQVKKTHQHLE